jgi:hypothetical protein
MDGQHLQRVGKWCPHPSGEKAAYLVSFTGGRMERGMEARKVMRPLQHSCAGNTGQPTH